MELEPKQAESKKTYEPPRLATINLRPQEAVLGACKQPGVTMGQFGTGCQPFSACPFQGS
jgi:hypothetical protein